MFHHTCSLDINECSIGSHVCHVNANCINTDGSHNCSCKEGFIGDGRSCSGTLNLLCYKVILLIANVSGISIIRSHATYYDLRTFYCHARAKLLNAEWVHLRTFFVNHEVNLVKNNT